jgi:hypothetical protein
MLGCGVPVSILSEQRHQLVVVGDPTTNTLHTAARKGQRKLRMNKSIKSRLGDGGQNGVIGGGSDMIMAIGWQKACNDVDKRAEAPTGGRLD